MDRLILDRLRIDGAFWRDGGGRRVLLRGINLGGSTKLPRGLTTRDPQLRPRGAVSFVGRPFPEAEADAHFARLRHWGFNCLRFLTTWEAIEPDEPGRHDEAYLDYLRRMVKRAGDFGLYVFLDPHQDAWSRASGGDGAPHWTLELAGFDLARLDASEAAITMANRPGAYDGMVWPNNWARLASATMFTLFFAGRRFAPSLKVGGESIELYLQRHFIGAMTAAASRLADLPHVLGYDSMNEPSRGLIGLPTLSMPLPVYNHGPQLTALEALAIPAGVRRAVPRLRRDGLRQFVDGEVVLNPAGVSAWQRPDRDVWRAHGVWDLDAHGAPRILRDDYFAGVEFYRDCVHPFVSRYGAALRSVHPGAALFIEGEPGAGEPLRAAPSDAPVVNASHWYDLLTLITKHYDPAAAMVWGDAATVTGAAAVRTSFAAQLGALAADSKAGLDGAPTLVGEFGVPFDLDDGAAFKSGDFSPQTAALSAYYDALDAHLLHATLWNYTADNTNDDGDHWNREDLSVFSCDQRGTAAGLDDGGRAVAGFCRPTVRACVGEPRRQRFDMATRRFELAVEMTPCDGVGPTIIYAPRLHYPRGVALAVDRGRAAYDGQTQLVTWHVDAAPEASAAAPTRATLTMTPA